MIEKTMAKRAMGEKTLAEKDMAESSNYLRSFLSSETTLLMWQFLEEMSYKNDGLATACDNTIFRMLQLGYTEYRKELFMCHGDVQVPPNPFIPRDEIED